MSKQLSLFSLEQNGVNANEAPLGFYAYPKAKALTPNVCNSCDARQLCVENLNNWCLNNRCCSGIVISFKDGKEYKRNDNQQVVFKLKENL